MNTLLLIVGLLDLLELLMARTMVSRTMMMLMMMGLLGSIRMRHWWTSKAFLDAMVATVLQILVLLDLLLLLMALMMLMMLILMLILPLRDDSRR
jgi:hypothetical protein